MKSFSVYQVSQMLDTNQETIRRWIRSGSLKASKSSRKGGYEIEPTTLTDFLREHPKYVDAAFSSLKDALRLQMARGDIGDNLMDFKQLFLDSASLKDDILKSEELIVQKRRIIARLELDIHREMERIEVLKFILSRNETI